LQGGKSIGKIKDDGEEKEGRDGDEEMELGGNSNKSMAEIVEDDGGVEEDGDGEVTNEPGKEEANEERGEADLVDVDEEDPLKNILKVPDDTDTRDDDHVEPHQNLHRPYSLRLTGTRAFAFGSLNLAHPTVDGEEERNVDHRPSEAVKNVGEPEESKVWILIVEYDSNCGGDNEHTVKCS